MDERILEELESLHGIGIGPGLSGVEEDVVANQLVTLLAAMGLEIAAPAELPALLTRDGLARWRRPLDPLLAVSEGAGRIEVEVRLPEAVDAELDWLLIEENGDRHAGIFLPADLEAVSSFRSGEEGFVARRLILELSLPCGYHQLTVKSKDSASPAAATLTLVVAPATCYIPPGIAGENRIWGFGLHLHSVRSRRNWGIGDFSDLREILAWGAEQGIGVLNLPPLHALSFFKANAGNPYAPSCRSMLNPLYLDVEEIADFRESDKIREQVGNPKFQARLASLREQEKLDYQAVAETKFEIFRLLWQHFSTYHLDPETDRGREFRQFQAEGGEFLRAYGTYSALSEKFRPEGQLMEQDWRDWPVEFRDPAGVAEFADAQRGEVEFYQYLQWLARLQLAAVGRRSMELGLKLGLLTELAFGPERNGFETWYYRGLYAENLVHSAIGGGERTVDAALGLPLVIPARLRELGYGPFIEPLRQVMRQAGGLAVRGFHHFFESVPGPVTGDSPPALVVHSGFAEILAILTLESRRNRCLVVVDSPDGCRMSMPRC